MRIDVITLFPEYFEVPLRTSITGRAEKNGLVEFYFHQLRNAAADKHGTVDDTPYGGGPGMVLKIDVLKRALDNVIAQGPDGVTPHTILLCPQGDMLNQPLSQSLSTKPWLIFICGHYEGFDERIREYVDQEISVGPYVLSGGEPAALIVIDSVVRLIPGGTGHSESVVEESFSFTDEEGNPLIEYPHYTRPLEFDGKKVPDILLSGDHAKIAAWRLEQAKVRTKKKQS